MPEIENIADEPIEFDGDFDAALNDGGDETAASASPTEDKKTTEGTNGTGSEDNQNDGGGDSDDNSNAKDTEVKDNQRPDKRSRANDRIRDLVGKVREKDEYIESLQAQLNAKMTEADKPELKRDENGEVDVDDLVAHSEKVAISAAERAANSLREQLEAEKVATRLDREVSESFRKHPMLDPDSGEFNEKVALATEKLVRSKIDPHVNAKNVKALSNVSAAAIIDEYMEGVYAAANAAAAKASATLAQQQNQSSGMFDGQNNNNDKQTEKDEFEQGFDSVI